LLESRQLLSTNLTLPLRFDFGTSTSPVAPGHTGVPLVAYSARRGYGWQSLTGLSAIDRGTANPLTRDLDLGRDNTFLVDLPNGTYDITAWLGDPKYARDQVAIWGEGNEVASGLTTAAGEVVQPTFRVAVTDGQLTLRFADQGGSDPG
jgi:fibronectin type 3 domain-containing protein